MKVTAIVAFRLAVFLAIAGVVYAVTSREPAGGSLLVVVAVCFTYVGLILRAAIRSADRALPETRGGEEKAPQESEHVGPTIWPFAFSLAAIGLVLGIALARWLLIAGAALFVASAVGWFVDVRRQHAQAHLR
jgi:hypothetical protein